VLIIPKDMIMIKTIALNIINFFLLLLISRSNDTANTVTADREMVSIRAHAPKTKAVRYVFRPEGWICSKQTRIKRATQRKPAKVLG
jgi:hypothetical protein